MISKEVEVEAMADIFIQNGVKNVIIKMGAKGCYIRVLYKECRQSVF